MGREKKTKACYNCVKRRIICDASEPHCYKCSKKNLECPGYGIRYRFAERKIQHPGPEFITSGSAAKRKLKDASKCSTLPQKTNPCLDQGSREFCFSQVPQPESVGSEAGPMWTRTSDRIASKGFIITDVRNNIETDPTSRTPGGCDGQIFYASCQSHKTLATSIPAPLLDLDVNIIFHFEHFAARVSPYMLMFDDEANGYRHHVLPLAHSDSIVQRTVCVVSALHLSQKQPRLRRPAEEARAAIISELSGATRVGSKARSGLSESTWATLLLLLVGDLVAGHEDVVALLKLLLTFMEAHSPETRPLSTLGSFLYYQSSIMRLFARTAIDELSAAIQLQEFLPSPVDFFEQYSQRQRHKGSAPTFGPRPRPESRLQEHFAVYEVLYRLAIEIYIARAQQQQQQEEAQSPLLGCGYMEERVAQIHALCEQVDIIGDGGAGAPAPGAHAVVWPVFVAAAETDDEAHRRFFVRILTWCWETTGYTNILRGLEVLEEVRTHRGRKRWTAMLPECKGFIMC